jgi:hypothetical protein
MSRSCDHAVGGAIGWIIWEFDDPDDRFIVEPGTAARVVQDSTQLLGETGQIVPRIHD